MLSLHIFNCIGTGKVIKNIQRNTWKTPVYDIHFVSRIKKYNSFSGSWSTIKWNVQAESAFKLHPSWDVSFWRNDWGCTRHDMCCFLLHQHSVQLAKYSVSYSSVSWNIVSVGTTIRCKEPSVFRHVCFQWFVYLSSLIACHPANLLKEAWLLKCKVTISSCKIENVVIIFSLPPDVVHNTFCEFHSKTVFH